MERHTNSQQDPAGSPSDGSQFEEFIDPVDGQRWRIDVGFTDSNWTCIWGNGCEGIRDELSADLGEGCCSVGAHLIDDEEAMLIGALGVSLDPARFQQSAEAVANGVLADGSQLATRVVDDACIFFNKPGFSGGSGCALHLGALDEGEPPMDWKPSICWQAPLKVDEDEHGTKTLRPWVRADWTPSESGAEEKLAWCCTEPNGAANGAVTAYIGKKSVAETLEAELQGLVGPEVAVQLKARAQKFSEPQQ